ncbi:hypothetical protein AYI70_g9983 [Smittium culicis]|uniref:PSP1 C-terminal domain-containing protein n=1 Tax=Smittium culicis TaxID=133412 RepID=A0A1R1X8P1_9FUNG|nr:hypothetical protein AYI70_g9983 [Smittium culicis]
MLSFSNTLDQSSADFNSTQPESKKISIDQLKSSVKITSDPLTTKSDSKISALNLSSNNEPDFFPENESFFNPKTGDFDIGWKAVGSQSTRVLGSSLSKDDQSSIWGLDSLIEDTNKLSFESSNNISKLGGMMVGNSSINSSSNMDHSVYSSEPWPAFSRSLEKDSFETSDQNVPFKLTKSSIDIKNINRFAPINNHSLISPQNENDLGLSDINNLSISAAAADAAAEAEFVDSVLMSAMDTTDKSSSHNPNSSLNSRASGVLYPLNHHPDSINTRPNVVPRHSSFDLSDLNPKSSLNHFSSNNSNTNSLFSKNNQTNNAFSDLSSYSGQPLPLIGQSSDPQNNNPYNNMRYRSAIQTMQYYDNFYSRNNGPGLNFNPSQNLGNMYPINNKPNFSGLNDNSQNNYMWPSNNNYLSGSLKNDSSFSFNYNRPPLLHQPNFGSLNFNQNNIGVGLLPSNLSQNNPSQFSSISAMKMQMQMPNNIQQNNLHGLNSYQNSNHFYNNNNNNPNNSSLSEMGRGVPLNLLPSDARIFVVQFKGKRNDLFFYSKSSSDNKSNSSKPIAPGVCAIVEADRGQDLGLIIEEYHSKDQALQFMSSKFHDDDSKDSNSPESNKNNGPYSPKRSDSFNSASSISPQFSDIVKSNLSTDQNTLSNEPPKEKTPATVNNDNNNNSNNLPQANPKDVSIKRIFRLADSTDIDVMVTKSQDEQKALLVCQAKVRSLKLPMEVVDAEYQWDRRKLIFFFSADHRIDFRELVRELFKTYKTRIWMCAVEQR